MSEEWSDTDDETLIFIVRTTTMRCYTMPSTSLKQRMKSSTSTTTMTSAKGPETRQHHRAQVSSDNVAAKFATSRRLAKQSNALCMRLMWTAD